MKIKNESPLVTVIIPSYNHEKYIQKSIESIVNQTYKQIELIVIDDGSVDASPRIIANLSKKYNFKYLHRPNKGLSATINEGLSISSGLYLCVCSSDDIFIANKIEKQVALMELNPEFAMCFGKVININNDGNEVKCDPKHAKSGWVFEEIFYQTFTMPPATVMIRKEVFKIVGNYDETSFIEDWDLYLRIVDKYQVGYLNEYLTYYRLHDMNMSKQKSKIYEAQKCVLRKWDKSRYYKKAMILWRLKWFDIFASRNKRKGFKWFIMNIKYFYYRRFIKGTIQLFFIGWIHRNRK